MEDDCSYYSDSDNDSIGERFISDRRANDQRLKSRFEHIFQKYERDFTGIGDEILLRTGEIVVNNGHLESMTHEVDPGQVAASTFIDSFAHDYIAPTGEATPEVQVDDDDEDDAFRKSLSILGNEIDRLDSVSPYSSSEGELDDDDLRDHHAQDKRHVANEHNILHPALVRVGQAQDATSNDTDNESEYNTLPSQIRVLKSMPGVFKDSLLAMQSEHGPFDKASLDQLEHNIAAQVAQFLAASNPAMYNEQLPDGVRESAWAYPELPPRKRQRLENPSAARPTLSSSAALFTKSPRGRASLWAPASNDGGWDDLGPASESDNDDDDLLSANDSMDAQARFMSVVRDHATPAPQASSAPRGGSLYAANTARQLNPKQPGQQYSRNRPVVHQVIDFIHFVPKQMRKHVEIRPPDSRAGVMVQWKQAIHLQPDVPPALAPKVLPTNETPKARALPPVACGPIHNSEGVLALQKKFVRKLASRRFLEGSSDELKRVMFSEEEDRLLVHLRHNRKLDWHDIEEEMPSRSYDSLYNRYFYIRRTMLPDVLEPDQPGSSSRPAAASELGQVPKNLSKRGQWLRGIFATSDRNGAPENDARREHVPNEAGTYQPNRSETQHGGVVPSDITHPPAPAATYNEISAEVAPQPGPDTIEEVTEPDVVPDALPENLALPYEFTEEDDRAIRLMREKRHIMFDDIAMHFPGTSAEAIGYRYFNVIAGRKFPPQTKEMKAAVEKIAARPSVRRRVKPQEPSSNTQSATAPSYTPEVVVADMNVNDEGNIAVPAQLDQSQSRFANGAEIPNSTASQHGWTVTDKPEQGPWVWQPPQSFEDKTSSKHDSVLDDTLDTEDGDRQVFYFPDMLQQTAATPPSSPPMPLTGYGPPVSWDQQGLPYFREPNNELQAYHDAAFQPSMPVIDPALSAFHQTGPLLAPTGMAGTVQHRSILPVNYVTHTQPNVRTEQGTISQHQPLQSRSLQPLQPRSLQPLQPRPLQPVLSSETIRQALQPRERHSLPSVRPSIQYSHAAQGQGFIAQDANTYSDYVLQRSQNGSSASVSETQINARPAVTARPKKSSQPAKPRRKRKSVVLSASESESGSEFDPDSTDDDQAYESHASLRSSGARQHEDDDDDYSSSSDYKAAPKPSCKVVLEPPARDRFLQIAAQMIKPRSVQVPRNRPILICNDSEDDDHSDYGVEPDTGEESADDFEKDRLKRSRNKPALAEAAMKREAAGELRNLAARAVASSAPVGEPALSSVTQQTLMELTNPAGSCLVGIETSIEIDPGADTTIASTNAVVARDTTTHKRRKIGPWEESASSDDSDGPRQQSLVKKGATIPATHQGRVHELSGRPSPNLSSSTKSTSRSHSPNVMTKERASEKRRASASFTQHGKASGGHRHNTKTDVRKRQSAPSRLNEVQRFTHDLSEDELA